MGILLDTLFKLLKPGHFAGDLTIRCHLDAVDQIEVLFRDAKPGHIALKIYSVIFFRLSLHLLIFISSSGSQHLESIHRKNILKYLVMLLNLLLVLVIVLVLGIVCQSEG